MTCQLLLPNNTFKSMALRTRLFFRSHVVILGLLIVNSAGGTEHLPGSTELTRSGDLSAQMVEGIDRFLDRATAASVSRRAEFWARDLSSPSAYARSIQANRERFRRMIGAVDKRVRQPTMEILGEDRRAEFTVLRVRWSVFDGVHGEGLIVRPRGPIKARVIVLPDAGVAPEALLTKPISRIANGSTGRPSKSDDTSSATKFRRSEPWSIGARSANPDDRSPSPARAKADSLPCTPRRLTSASA